MKEITFNEYCDMMEQITPFTFEEQFEAVGSRVIPALYAMGGASGVALFTTFLLGAIAADGKLSEAEFHRCRPLFDVLCGPNATYEQCSKEVAALRKEGRELKKVVAELVGLLGELSAELKTDVIHFCVMVCAVDGKISFREKNWIKQLID